ncbi:MULTISPECIES: hypothetical protein [unclassified Fusibacter]|uniref:hypothetical protein n=1 Tax=unclassified Fusibacter TaxID=2624464 RepID=UPI0010127317|nr:MULTISPECIES: hypothetical protein [unclassified Fusibacter]MCK8059369.1 hypothetical protein [Fusibacter sp. A2]NPE21167.1 hypothetical protein [Fusibacter sp. A1]RXV62435.1 hypothetical protein DWB64_04975 [Fusibacter sp. A1]
MLKINKKSALRAVLLAVMLLILLMTKNYSTKIEASKVVDVLYSEIDTNGFFKLNVQEWIPSVPEGIDITWLRSEKQVLYKGRDLVKYDHIFVTDYLDTSEFKVLKGVLQTNDMIQKGLVVSSSFASEAFGHLDVVGLEVGYGENAKRIVGVADAAGTMKSFLSNDHWVLEVEELYGDGQVFYSGAIATSENLDYQGRVFVPLLSKYQVRDSLYTSITKSWLLQRLRVAFNSVLILFALSLVVMIYRLALKGFTIFVENWSLWNRVIEWKPWFFKHGLKILGLLIACSGTLYLLVIVYVQIGNTSYLDRTFYPADPTSIHAILDSIKYWALEILGKNVESQNLVWGYWQFVYRFALLVPVIQVLLMVGYFSAGKELTNLQAVKSDAFGSVLAGFASMLLLIVIKDISIGFEWVAICFALVGIRSSLTQSYS